MLAVNIETQVILDALGHGVLIFDGEGILTLHNQSAGKILGTDLNRIRSDGWDATVQMFNTGITDEDEQMDAVRAKALASDTPIRFYIFRAGQFIPCWALAIPSNDGQLYLMLTLDVADWRFISEILDKFKTEMQDAVDSTIGHIRLINKTLGLEANDNDPAKMSIIKRIGGFTRLIDLHMKRSARFLHMLNRLEDIRTGNLITRIHDTRKKINLEDFLEDLMEELDEIEILDPETEIEDYRGRIVLDIESAYKIEASRRYLSYVLQEFLRNALMYSTPDTPVTMKVTKQGQMIQVDVTDQGRGINDKNRHRVMEPFERARQPHVISEFGFGMCLYLCKHEVEAMNGRLWFKSDANVGSTFSMKLPIWRDDSSSSNDT